MREPYPSQRLHGGYTAILDAARDVRRRLSPERLRRLCAYPLIKPIIG